MLRRADAAPPSWSIVGPDPSGLEGLPTHGLRAEEAGRTLMAWAQGAIGAACLLAGALVLGSVAVLLAS